MKINFLSIATLLFSILQLTNSFAANTPYFLCGPDEDGCFSGQEQYCACIPYNTAQGSKPYCLNFDNMTCAPLTTYPDCDKNLIFKDQGSCIATIFQSEPTPGCRMVSKSFCEDHHTYICAEDGNPESCQKS
jgi:hypothetical protein